MIDYLSPEQAYAAHYGSRPKLPIRYAAKSDRLIFYTPSELEITVPLHFPDRIAAPRSITPPRSGSPLAHTLGGYCEIYQQPALMAWDPASQLMVPVLCSPLLWFCSRETSGGGTGSIGHAKRAEAELDLVTSIWFYVEMAEDKVTWMRDGDKTSGKFQARVIRCNSRHYTIGPEPSENRYWTKQDTLGHGGAKFRFRLLATGEIIESRNVWSQGEIPVEYRGLLADNAEAVRSE